MDKISENLFAKIRGRFPSITLGDATGVVTDDPKLARYFDFDFKDGEEILGKVSITLNEEAGVVITYNNDFITNEADDVKDNWYNFLREIRVFAKKNMLNFDTRDITKSNLDKRDYAHLTKTSSGDNTMSESTMYGTSRTSYEDVDKARLVLKHNQPVNLEIPGSRTQHVHSIYIESDNGERYRYPYRHLNGARALARHVSEGGNLYDDFGKHIVGLSEELAKLRQFKIYMNRSAVMAEGLKGYLDVVNERLETVKKECLKLQRENYYKDAIANYKQEILEDVPEDVSNSWIDELTIRSFNEELKSVFPYIYKLINDSKKVEEIGPENINNIQVNEWVPAVMWGITTLRNLSLAKKAWQGIKLIAKVSAKNPVKATVAGTAAMNPGATMDIAKGTVDVAKGAGDLVAKGGDLANKADDTLDMIQKNVAQAGNTIVTNANDLKDMASGALDNLPTLDNIADIAKQYAVPAAAVMAVIFGGYKVIQWIFGESNESIKTLEGFDPDKFEGSIEWEVVGDDGEESWADLRYTAHVDHESGTVQVDPKSVTGDMRDEGFNKARLSSHDFEDGLNSWPIKDQAAEILKDMQDDAEAMWADRDQKSHEELEPTGFDPIGEYEKALSYIVGEQENALTDGSDEDKAQAVERLNGLMREHFPAGVNGTNAIESLAGIIDDPKLQEMFRKVGQKNSDICVRPLVMKWIKAHAPDVHSQVDVGDMEAKEARPLGHPKDGYYDPKIIKTMLKKKGDDEGKKDNKKPSEKLEELIKSYYDYTTNRFPKGETAVMTAVEKEFGERSLPYAESMIQKLFHGQDREMERVKQLAGV